ncbi:hypothetical protein LOY41_12410 [Pseudomonas atacamensis]|uniref:MAE_28990/MAE_18760 family HEPN-like nuclease n=1 Tax=Pseudomonas atacamensis TaxID=2565368 RepID=UPI00215E8B25|nr:MAE_28990/MAE_18760 family HEPN-like nuclease [Pseudomonas atacamensis]UVM02049.1 hypothetical protein LOY41_12410 [Pseudomonas atacamensis]
MFEATRNGSTDRLSQASALINTIKMIEDKSEVAEAVKTQKGLVFILLYAALEYTATSIVSEFLTHLKTEVVKNHELKMFYLAVTLDANFKSLIGCSDKTFWSKKTSIIEAFHSQDAAKIDDSIFPATGTNIAFDQLEHIWKIFHLAGSPLPTGVAVFHLTELREHRNAIAHGRETAASVGRRFSSDTLTARFNLIALLCEHIVSTFEDATHMKAYLK